MALLRRLFAITILLMTSVLHNAECRSVGDAEPAVLPDLQADDSLAAMMVTHDHGPGMTMDPGMEHDMSMKMFFHVSNHATILFEQWHTMTWQEMLGSCIGLGIIAALYEGFKVARTILQAEKLTPKRTSGRHNQVIPIDNKGFNGDVTNINNNNSYGMGSDYYLEDGCCNPHPLCNGWHWLQTFLHVIQIFISYCLMLVFMTYNAWLCLAVVIGAGIGHLFFGWMTLKTHDVNEHCH